MSFPKLLTVVRIAAVASLVLVIFGNAAAGSEPRATDPGTTFHRLYVTGPGDNDDEEAGFIDDKEELEGDLETAENQADDSSTRSLKKPTKQQLRNTLNALKLIAEPGDEVTLYFGGHGGNDAVDQGGEESDGFDEFIWLNDANGDRGADLDEVVTDDELAEMLSGFRVSVTLVVILNACAAGGFTDGTDDIKETDHVSLIGATEVCPIEPPGLLGGFRETLGEAAADAAGERDADANDDGIVTAEELKAELKRKGWRLGPPAPGEHIDLFKKGKSACAPGRCTPSPPAIVADRDVGSPGTLLSLAGQHFTSDSIVSVNLVREDLTQVQLGQVKTSGAGSFATKIVVPNVAAGRFLIRAVDSQAWEDWTLFSIVSGPICGIAFDRTWVIEHETDRSLAHIGLSAVDYESNAMLADVLVRLSAFKPDGTSTEVSFRTPAGRQAEGTVSTTRPGEVRVVVEVLAGCQPTQATFEQSFAVGPCPGEAHVCEGPPPSSMALQRRGWVPQVAKDGTAP